MQSIKITRVGLAIHIYFIRLGKGKLVEFQGQCLKCSNVTKVDPADYLSLAAVPGVDLRELINQTNPTLHLASKSKRTGHDRQELIFQPIYRSTQWLEDRYSGGTKIDWLTGLAVFGTLGLPFLFGLVASSTLLDEAMIELLRMRFPYVFGVGVITSLVFMLTEPRRFFNRHILEEMVTILRALHPQEAQIESSFQALKAFRYRVGKYISTEKLIRLLRHET